MRAGARCGRGGRREAPISDRGDGETLAFARRVVIADGKYAGTWQHGKVGGHLFGKIVSEQTKDETAESVSLEK